MSRAYDDRQHVVNQARRAARSPDGDAFTNLVLEVAWLGALFVAAGESLAGVADQSLARWVVLDAVADQPNTVAQVARRRRIARQAVQRVADDLVRDGLAVYLPNLADRRAQLLQPTRVGLDAVYAISVAQTAWADQLGSELGGARLEQLSADVSTIRRLVSATSLPAPARRKRRRRSITSLASAGATENDNKSGSQGLNLEPPGWGH
jgi:DNA-binding MarR family transcriptional regulator